MSSWKQAFEMIGQELELARKKKQALDGLLAAGRVSQPTYEHLEEGLTGAIRDLEAQQRLLTGRMTGRADELEKQTSLLELFLADLEIRHAAGEIDGEPYNAQRQAITLGLEATKAELDQIRDSLMKIGPQKA